jgi:hypothetical protein
MTRARAMGGGSAEMAAYVVSSDGHCPTAQQRRDLR